MRLANTNGSSTARPRNLRDGAPSPNHVSRRVRPVVPASTGRGTVVEATQDGPQFLPGERLGQAILGPLWSRRDDPCDHRVKAMRQREEAKEAA